MNFLIHVPLYNCTVNYLLGQIPRSDIFVSQFFNIINYKKEIVATLKNTLYTWDSKQPDSPI